MVRRRHQAAQRQACYKMLQDSGECFSASGPPTTRIHKIFLAQVQQRKRLHANFLQNIFGACTLPKCGFHKPLQSL